VTMQSLPEEPRLSIVAGARNNDYGGRFLRRIQMFVNALAAQADRHRLRSELVLVDWCSLDPFADALAAPPARGWLTVRVIQVPPKVNEDLPYAAELPFREYHAKNVGIRRARAPFVLCTNVDLVYTDALMQGLSGDLREDAFYRADRLDVAAAPDPWAPLDEIIAACAGSVVRSHGLIRDIGVNRAPRQRSPRVPRQATRIVRAMRAAPRVAAEHARRPRDLPRAVRDRWHRELGLHTDASGDFVLLAKGAWNRLHGYPELRGHGVHVDGLFLYECHFAGLEQVILPGVVYHVEHERSRPPQRSMTAADEGKAPWISRSDLQESLLTSARRRGPVLPHAADWGRPDLDFPERDLA